MDLVYRFDPHQPISLPQDVDAAGVVASMEAGNKRFVELLQTLQGTMTGSISKESLLVRVCPLSLGLPMIPGLTPTQAPFVMVLGCSDARVPIEVVFDQFFNGMFVVRVAGNALNSEGLGSIQYAVKTMSESLKLGLVLGHTGCGAVTAAVDSYLNPHDYIDIGFSLALRAVLDRAMIAVRGADRAMKYVTTISNLEPAKRRSLLIELSIYLNAAITSYQVRKEVRELGNKEMRICYGVYNLSDGYVRPHPGAHPQEAKAVGNIFANSPESPDAFVTLGREWADAILSRGT